MSENFENVLRNPFLQPTPLDLIRLRELCKLASRTYQRGWNAGTAGNFSVRSTIKDVMWVSVSGLCKGELTPDNFIPVHITTARPLGIILSKPSDETALHAGIYRTMASANVIAHVHPPHLVRRTLTTAETVFSEQEMQKIFGVTTHIGTVRVPTIANTQDMDRLGREVGQYITAEDHALVLVGHGVYAWGPEAARTLNLIEAIEFMSTC